MLQELVEPKMRLLEWQAYEKHFESSRIPHESENKTHTQYSKWHHNRGHWMKDTTHGFPMIVCVQPI